MKEDTLKIHTILEICNQRGDITEQEKARYADSALFLSQKLAYLKGIAASHLVLAFACNNSGKYDEALKHLETVQQLAARSADRILLARIYNCFGFSWNSKADYSAALSWFLKALQVYEELQKRKEAADAVYNISIVYAHTQKYDKASEYTSRAAAEYSRLKDTLQLAMAETQLGDLAYEQYQYDTALVYYKRGLKITEHLKDQTYASVSLTGIGNVLFETGRYSEAMLYRTKALEVAREMGDEYSEANSLMNLGRAYAVQKKFAEAEKFLKEAITLARKIGARQVICNTYGHLSETYENKGDFKNALEYSWLYMDLKDSLFNEENTALINGLTAKYENEKKEKAIALLNAELSGKDAKVKEKNITILAIAGGTILLFVSAFLFFSRQRLKQKNKFQEELNEQQKKTAGAVIQMQENERNRIARELHDGIGTFLSTLKINLQVLESSVENAKMGPYRNNSELLDRTSEELRKITKGLSSEVLQEKGLAQALHELVAGINASGFLPVKFLADDTVHRYDALLETNYYRIAQELLNNSIKYSKATKITLQLIDHEDTVLLMLEDNGVGFDPAHAAKGMGLKNIRNRAEFLNGTCKVESAPGRGSTFIIEAPKKSPNLS